MASLAHLACGGGDVLAIRYDNWKLVFMEQRCRDAMGISGEPFTIDDTLSKMTEAAAGG